jgi:HEAT repeat protein
LEATAADTAQEVVLEEERVKDEIDIQIDLLEDPDWVVRREAVITLGEMGDERCVAPLVRALRDGDWQVREVAIEALGQVGSPAVEELIKLLRDWDVRKYAIHALGKIRDERVLDPLMKQLHNDEFKDDATDALVELGEPAVPCMIEALNDKDEMVRKQAVLALGRIKASAAIDALIEKLRDNDWFTRLTAAAALESIGAERGREAIRPLLKDPDLVVRMRVERILAKWKKQPHHQPANA